MSPPVLLPYQQRWIADRSKIKVCEKSRRIGVSWADAADSALEAARSNGVDTYYVGYNKEMSEQYILDVAFWAKAYGLAASAMEEFVFRDEDKDILGFRIRFASGFKVVALSSRPSNLRSKKGRIRIDEAAFHDDLAELLKAALAIVMWGGTVAIWSTHDGETNPFNQLVQDIRQGERDYSLHRITLDDAIADGLYKRICLVQGIPWTLEGEFAWRAQLFKDYGKAANEELLCIPCSSTDVLFDAESVDRQAKGMWREPLSSRVYLAMVDPNFGGSDFWVTLVWDITESPYSLVAQYRDQNKSTSHSRKETVRLMDLYRPVITAVESNSGGTVVAEKLSEDRPSMRIELTQTTHSSKRVNTDRVAMAVEYGDVIYPPDWEGISEMKRFGALSREAMGGNDDCVMSFAAGWAWLDQAKTSIPRVRSAVIPTATYNNPFG